MPGRTLAIGDIHGCARAFDALLTFLAILPDDRIITLGDYVDRGPDSRTVLDRLIALHATGQFISLRGNHELLMLRARDSLKEEKLWRLYGGDPALASYVPPDRAGKLDDVPAEHWRFMSTTCRDWYETDTHIFVHAGVDPALPLDEQDEQSLYWNTLVDRGPHLSGKTVICGHTGQPSGWPLDFGHTICIDTLAYGGQWLTALDVGTRQFWQTNERGDNRTDEL